MAQLSIFIQGWDYHLLFSRLINSRVARLQAVSIPRLKLMAAVSGLQLTTAALKCSTLRLHYGYAGYFTVDIMA
jgi:hypothetical protein